MQKLITILFCLAYIIHGRPGHDSKEPLHEKELVRLLSALSSAAAFYPSQLQAGFPKEAMASSKPVMASVAAGPTKARLTYFPVFAKGPASALALEFSGIDWEGAFPENWAEMKPHTPFLELPVLFVPGVGEIAQEIAILNYIGCISTVVGGATPAEFMVSQQLMGQAEDIYQKLSLAKRGLLDEEKVKSFWTNTDTTQHNRDFGAFAYFTALEAFAAKCGFPYEGKFTTSGKTVGECKLWSVLHSCVMIKPDCLTSFRELRLFYERFMAMPETKALIETGLRFPAPFKQYFSA